MKMDMIRRCWQIGIFIAALSGLAIACERGPIIETINSTNQELFAYVELVPIDQQLPWKPNRTVYPGADAQFDPGEQKKIYAIQWPLRERFAPDEKGVLTFVDGGSRIVYQRFYTWSELAAEDWTVSLDLAAAIEQQGEP